MAMRQCVRIVDQTLTNWDSRKPEKQILMGKWRRSGLT